MRVYSSTHLRGSPLQGASTVSRKTTTYSPVYTQQFGMLRTSTLIPQDRCAPFRLRRCSYRWRLKSRIYLLSSRCNQPSTSRVVASSSIPVGVGDFWLWCLRRKSLLDFPKHPSAFSHPEYSSGAVRPHKTRSSRELYSPTVPKPESLCVSIRVLCHFLRRHSSNIPARIGTGASCTTKMLSFFYRASPSKAS